MLFPEIIIYKSLINILDYIREDYKVALQNGDVTTCLLYNILGLDDNELKVAYTEDRDSLFDDAVAMLMTDPKENVDNFNISVGYNRQRVEGGRAHVHIILPTEQKGSMNIIGNVESNTLEGDKLIIDKKASKRALYHLMITSQNMTEVLIVYYILQAVFLLWDYDFELKGLRNIKVSGADISHSDTPHQHTHHRNCTLDFEYEYHIKTKLQLATLKGFNFAFCADIAEDNNNYPNHPE